MFSLASLNGTYGYYRFGKNYGDAPDSDITSVGYITFDGKGKATSSQQTSRSGSYNPALPDFPPPIPLSYTVNSIGTFAVMDAAKNVISNGVILGGGNEFYSLSRTTTTG